MTKSARRVALSGCLLGLLIGAAASAALAGATATPRFVARGNAVCATFYRGTAQLPRPKTHTDQTLAAYLKSTLPVQKKLVRGLEALTPPAAKRHAFSELIAVARKEIAATKLGISAKENHDANAFAKMLQQTDALNSHFSNLATKLGLTACVVK